MAGGGPQLELHVAGGLDLHDGALALIGEREPAHALRMAAVEAFREPQDGRERAYDGALSTAELPKALVASLWRGASVIAGDERDDVDFVGLEAPQIAIANEVVGVLVVRLVTDVDADVVQECRVLEPLVFLIGQPVPAARGVEQPPAQAGDLLRMIGGIVTAFSELDHTPTPHVWIAVRVCNPLAMSRDVVEYEPLAQ